MVQCLNGKSFLQKCCFLLCLLSVVLQNQIIFCSCSFYKSSLILPLHNVASFSDNKRKENFIQRFLNKLFALLCSVQGGIYQLCSTAVIPRLKPLIDGFNSTSHNISEVFEFVTLGIKFKGSGLSQKVVFTTQGFLIIQCSLATTVVTLMKTEVIIAQRIAQTGNIT